MKKFLQIVALAGAVLLVLGLSVALVQRQFSFLVKLHLIVGALFLVSGLAANLREAREFLAARTMKMGPQVILQALLLVIILVFANYLILHHDWIQDLTILKLYTLRGPTIKTMKGLPGKVEVKAFFPGGGDTEPRERLKVYENRFPDQVELEFIDPDKNEDEARREAVPPRPGVLFKYGDKRTWIEKYDEQSITNSFIKVTRATTPVVWFTTNHGEPLLSADGSNGLSSLDKLLKEQGYENVGKDLREVDRIPPEVSMIALVGLTQKLTTHERDLLDAYVARGGNLLITLDPRWDPAQETGLEDFILPFHVRARNDLIRDEVHRLAEDKTGLWLVTSKINRSSAISSQLTRPNLVFYWTRALEASAIADPKFAIEPLVSSENESFEKRISPGHYASLATEEEKNQYIADLLQQGPIPPEQNGPFVLAYSVLRFKDTRNWLGDEKSDEMRMVILGSSSILRNLAISMPYNYEFVANCFNWLAGEKDLKNIQAPERGGSRIVLNNNEKNWILYVTVMILPEAFMIVGLAIWWRKR